MDLLNYSKIYNKLSPDEKQEFVKTIKKIINKKILNVENTYNVKMKIPKSLCKLESDNDNVLPILPMTFNNGILSTYVPMTSLINVSNDNDEHIFENLTSCMNILNETKQQLIKYTNNQLNKSDITNKYFDWQTKKQSFVDNTHKLYEEKFGKKTMIDKFIKQLEKIDEELNSQNSPIISYNFF